MLLSNLECEADVIFLILNISNQVAMNRLRVWIIININIKTATHHDWIETSLLVNYKCQQQPDAYSVVDHIVGYRKYEWRRRWRFALVILLDINESVFYWALDHLNFGISPDVLNDDILELEDVIDHKVNKLANPIGKTVGSKRDAHTNHHEIYWNKS